MRQSVHEPKPANYSTPIIRYFAATRPAFLIATLAACLLGIASAVSSGIHFQPGTAFFTLTLALLIHAGVNVLNDYFDALNGTDAINKERLYPFTGGSRFIQNNVMTQKQMAFWGYVLFAIAVIGGLVLSWYAGPGLLVIGMLGMLIGWAYSAPPLSLNSRGLGELCVLAGFLGIVIGADYVQRQAFSYLPLLVGVPYALLVTNLLYINQFPDRKADAAAGKHTLVVRLPLAWAAWIYFAFIVMAFVWLVAMAEISALPLLAILSALPLLLSLRAFWLLRQFSARPAQLLPAIKLTLAAMLSHALLLALILLWNMP